MSTSGAGLPPIGFTIKFDDEESALSAVRDLNGQLFMGQPVKVEIKEEAMPWD